MAAARLPPAVLTGHVMVAGGGLLDFRLRPPGLGSGGRTRAGGDARARDGRALARCVPGRADSCPASTAAYADLGPPERHFPVPVVIAHGVVAVATLTLVLLTEGVGGS